MHKPESLMNLKCGLVLRCGVRCLPNPTRAQRGNNAASGAIAHIRSHALEIFIRNYLWRLGTSTPILREDVCFQQFVHDFFFLPQVFSNTTNVSKFGSADFQQRLSDRTDGTSSVKPRVRHYASFPGILSATYATPAPTASATTLPAGRVGQRGQYIKCTHRVMCKRGPRFQREPDYGRNGHFRDPEMCKTLIQCCIPFPYSKGTVRTVRISRRKLILYHRNIIRLSWIYLMCISRWRKSLP